MKLSILAVFSSSVLCVTASSFSVPSQDRSQIERQIRSRAESFLEALFGMDAEKLLDHFDRDTKMIINGRTYSTYEVIADHWRDTFSSRWASASGEWDELEVKILGPDAAMVHGNFHGVINRPSGEIDSYPVVPYTILFERRGEQWLVSFIHESIDPRTVERQGGSAKDRSAQ